MVLGIILGASRWSYVVSSGSCGVNGLISLEGIGLEGRLSISSRIASIASSAVFFGTGTNIFLDLLFGLQGINLKCSSWTSFFDSSIAISGMLEASEDNLSGCESSKFTAIDNSGLLVQSKFSNLLIDQGLDDPFLEEGLKPNLLKEICQKHNQEILLRMQEGYDHSYYFISTFMNDHINWHNNFFTE